ncbi:MAG: hypothetical protein H6Q74_2971 [Firmicutes bacterium]|nr:hypothetical protein [Bacillota bacterium]
MAVKDLGGLVFTVVATMTVLIAAWSVMGKRHVGEMSAADFAVSVTAGTVAGVGIADSRIEVGRVLIALGLLGLVQLVLSWISLKSRSVYKKIGAESVVLIEDGQIIKANLRKVRLTIEMLLQLLREKGVFDITEVELAVLEATGRLSVLKKAEFLPLKPSQVDICVAGNSILYPVIVEGKLEEKALSGLGCTEEQIKALRRQCNDTIDEIFVAFMDKNHRIHVVKEGVKEKGTFLH